MTHKLYIPILLAAAITIPACSDEDAVFDTSAAERLEAGRQEYTQALTADGGTWALEYFTNFNEPGYTFVCQFEPDGSVTISGDHQWINNTFTSEKSLWKVICDNGNVLSFNTYNNVFHILSSPEDIPSTPVNELGYGHEGDYEFMLMPRTEDSIRLIGKKHGLTAWLHKLPADTDPREHLESISIHKKVFSSKFPNLTLTDSQGENYTVTNLAYGLPSILSDLSTSPNSQTVSGNGIFTPTGFRFMEPLTVVRHDDSTWQLTELSWQEDGALACNDARIIAPLAHINFTNSQLSWVIDKESMSPALQTAHDDASNALVANYGSARSLRDITFGVQSKAGKPSFALTTRCGKFICNDFLDAEYSEDGSEVTLSLNSIDNSSNIYNTSTPEYKAFKALFIGTYSIANIDAMNPSVIVLQSKTNPDIHFNVNVQ